MRTLFPLVVALVVLALPGGALAEEKDQHLYLEHSGEMVVGLEVASHELLNEATFEVTPVNGFHRLRFALAFSPDGLVLDTPVIEGKLRYRFLLRLFDAETGESLLKSPMRYDGPATYTYEAPDERPIRVVLTMAQGAAVSYDFRVNALPDPQPV